MFYGLKLQVVSNIQRFKSLLKKLTPSAIISRLKVALVFRSMNAGRLINTSGQRIVIEFNESRSAPYFLNPGDSLPAEWLNNYTLKSATIA